MTSREEQIENLGIAMDTAMRMAEKAQDIYEDARKKYYGASTISSSRRRFGITASRLGWATDSLGRKIVTDL